VLLRSDGMTVTAEIDDAFNLLRLLERAQRRDVSGTSL
jgi:hypothetical protein